MLLVNTLLVCLAIGLSAANETTKDDSEKGLPGNYKLVKVTVDGEVKDVKSYILKLRKREGQDYFVVAMSLDGVGNNLDGTIERKSIDAEGEVYKFSGAYSKLGLTTKQHDDGELIYPGMFKLRRIKLNDKFGELTIIAPETNTILQFKREIPEEKPKE